MFTIVSHDYITPSIFKFESSISYTENGGSYLGKKDKLYNYENGFLLYTRHVIG